MNTNSIQLIGNLGRDPEIIKTSSGAKVGKVSIATSESYKDSKSGERVTQTQWHNLVAWGELADFMENNLRKGLQVAVRGKIRYKSFENKAGEKKMRTEILVREFITENS